MRRGGQRARSTSPLAGSFFSSERFNNRSPHSFPTRRSSDLFGPCRKGRSHVSSTRPLLIRGGIVVDPSRIRRRSEEHTSELQSLRQLVCRLRLEKQKI